VENTSYDTGIQRCENRRQLAQELGTKVEGFQESLKKDGIRFKAVLDALDNLIAVILKNQRWWEQELKEEKPVIIGGDFNVAHTPEDLAQPAPIEDVVSQDGRHGLIICFCPTELTSPGDQRPWPPPTKS